MLILQGYYTYSYWKNYLTKVPIPIGNNITVNFQPVSLALSKNLYPKKCLIHKKCTAHKKITYLIIKLILDFK